MGGSITTFAYATVYKNNFWRNAGVLQPPPPNPLAYATACSFVLSQLKPSAVVQLKSVIKVNSKKHQFLGEEKIQSMTGDPHKTSGVGTPKGFIDGHRLGSRAFFKDFSLGDQKFSIFSR